MNLASALLVSIMILFIMAGLPIAFTIIAACIAAVAVSGTQLSVLAQRLYSTNNSFALMAIFYFFVAGELMLQVGISKRIVAFSKCLFGWVKGNLAIITVVSSAFFGAISGSAFATCAAIGSIMYPEMKKEGYEEGFAALITSSAGILGILIPPSISCVVYAVLTGASAGDMFLYIAPVGITVTVAECIICRVLMRIKPYYYQPVNTEQWKRPTGRELWLRFKDAVWALLSPVVILGGIYSGVFTPTESAVISIVYAFIVGFFIYKELNVKNTIQALLNASIGSGVILFIMDAGGPFSWLLNINRLPQFLTEFTLSMIDGRVAFLMMSNLLFLLAGMFLEANCIMMIIIPIMLPMIKALDINLVHFGCVVIFNLTIGCITPPFGGTLFVASGITKVPVGMLIKRVPEFLIGLLITLLLVTYVPFLWLY